MLLGLDVGNSRTKCFLFDSVGRIMERQTKPTHKRCPADLAGEIAPLVTNASHVCIASVVPEVNGALRQMAHASRRSVQFVSDSVGLPFTIRYEAGRLGADRIAAAAGACALRPNADRLVFDIGTAFTMGVVLREGIFDGGLIAAGPSTAMQALGERASQLMGSVLAVTDSVVARTTPDALRAGFFHGYAAMIEGLVGRVTRMYSRSFDVLLTGGGAPVLSEGLAIPHALEPDLVAIGLHRIHELDR